MVSLARERGARTIRLDTIRTEQLMLNEVGTRERLITPNQDHAKEGCYETYPIYSAVLSKTWRICFVPTSRRAVLYLPKSPESLMQRVSVAETGGNASFAAFARPFWHSSGISNYR